MFVPMTELEEDDDGGLEKVGEDMATDHIQVAGEPVGVPGTQTLESGRDLLWAFPSHHPAALEELESILPSKYNSQPTGAQKAAGAFRLIFSPHTIGFNPKVKLILQWDTGYLPFFYSHAQKNLRIFIF